LGEVFKPEDLVEGKKPSDLSSWPSGISSSILREIIRDVRLLKAEVKKIKEVLRANGIIIK
jgi:hypothetical protein